MGIALFVNRAAWAAPPRVAFVDFDKSAAGSLLEGRLLARPGYDWVERQAIERVLQEQETQALFSPTGVTTRSSLGRLIKADYLIMLRRAPVKALEADKAIPPTAQQLDLVICETLRGVRLAVHSSAVAGTGNEAALVERLERWTTAALQQADRQITDICAVPPLVSQDLSFSYDYLKRAYANVVERAVFQQGRFAVVELAEAETLAKELNLTGGAALDRRLPLYVLGEYRHDGQGAARRVRIRLRLMRGQQLLDSAEESDLAPADATSFLQRSTTEMLRTVSGEEGSAFKPEVESRQLAERAREFMSLGHFEEAIPLQEAALLLRPDDHDARREAVIACGKVGSRYAYHPNEPEIAIPAIRQFRRGMEHLEIWLSANPNSPLKNGWS